MDWPRRFAEFGVFAISLTALTALVGGLIGMRLSQSNAMPHGRPPMIAVGVLGGLALCLALHAYFGSVFFGLLIAALFITVAG
jgi:hypothetical protein